MISKFGGWRVSLVCYLIDSYTGWQRKNALCVRGDLSAPGGGAESGNTAPIGVRPGRVAMARDARETFGEFETWIDCPMCDFEGIVYYNRKQPQYCSDRCKQRAYRRRKCGDMVIAKIPIDDLQITDDLKRKIHLFAGVYGIDAGNDLVNIVLMAMQDVESKWLNRNGLGVTYFPDK